MTLLAAFDAAPVDPRFAMVHRWMEERPRELFTELRASRPVLVTPTATLVALYDDVIEVLRLHDIYSVEPYRRALGVFMLAQDDTAEHARDKAIMSAMLDRADTPRLRALCAEAADASLDAACGSIDAVTGLARHVPISLVERYFGFADAPPGKLAEWSWWAQRDGFHNYPWDLIDDPNPIHDAARRCLGEMKDYLVALLQRRVSELKAGGSLPDDILCRLLQSRFAGPVGLPPPRLILNVGGLLIGAVETTSQCAAQVLAFLLAHPRLPEAIAAAKLDDPASFDGWVWEALRFVPMSHYLFRRTTAPHTLRRGTPHETTIPAGTAVLPLIGSACFDPTRFPEPDRFDPNRPVHDSFHLGWGLHSCLGAHIGWVMVPEIVRRALRRPGIRATGPIDRKGGPFPESLPIAWNG